jgi:hypothetical protein
MTSVDLPGAEPTTDRVLDLLAQAKQLAREYRALTGKPLGVTGEVAEYEAARLGGLKLEVQHLQPVRCCHGRSKNVQATAA